MDFGDLEFNFSHNELQNETYSKSKEGYNSFCKTLCSKYESFDSTIHDLVKFDDEKKTIEIIVPSNWQSNELFVLLLLQTQALSIIDIPGFHRHIPSDLNNFSAESKDEFFNFFNVFLKEIEGEFYAGWQVYTDGMYWSLSIEVSPNNDGDFAIVDFNEEAYDEEEYDEDY